VTLDGFASSVKANAPSLIKVDVEGEEHEVLRGAVGLLAQHRIQWLIELHGPTQAELCVGLLRSYGYDITALDGSAIVRYPALKEGGRTEILARRSAAL
jgi:hypothetical protein